VSVGYLIACTPHTQQKQREISNYLREIEELQSRCNKQATDVTSLNEDNEAKGEEIERLRVRVVVAATSALLRISSLGRSCCTRPSPP
jgi:hypothetical protein